MPEREEPREKEQRLAFGQRLEELKRSLAALEDEIPAPEPAELVGLHSLLIDAILDWDEAALELTLDALPPLVSLARKSETPEGWEAAGQLVALIGFAQCGLERVLPVGFVSQFAEPRSNSHRFLEHVHGGTNLSNAALALELDVDESEVSRLGRRLGKAGLVRKRRLGRTNQWLITPRGVQVLAVLDKGGIDRPMREHRQLQT